MSKQKIAPCLWFDDDAEEAIEFYVSIFEHSKIHKTTRYGDTGPGPIGSVMTIAFQLHGQEYVALNGGPAFKFTEAISLVVSCKDQKEVDETWAKLLQGGGQESQCGWLKDRFGLSWQVVPARLPELLQDSDPEKSRRVMEAILQMRKIDIDRLEEVYEEAH